MADRPEVSGGVIPHLVAALVCEAAVTDPITHKKTLIGIFDRIFTPGVPFQRPVSLYLKLSDGLGNYKLFVEFVRTKTDTRLGEINGKFEMASRLESVDFLIETPPLPIPDFGRYDFRVFTNGELLGGAFLDVLHLPKQG